MDKANIMYKETLDRKVLENSSKWQINKDPLASLSEAQLEVIYQISDVIKSEYYTSDEKPANANSHEDHSVIPAVIDTNQEFIKWLVKVENEMQHENFVPYNQYNEKLTDQSNECNGLYTITQDTINALEQLKLKYEHVTTKTDSLHSLSDQLMTYQKYLKDVKVTLKEKLHYFVIFEGLKDSIDRHVQNVNNKEFMEILDHIDNAIKYLSNHLNYREARIYQIRYESLLSTALLKVCSYVNNVIIDTTKQVTDPENNLNLLNLENSSGDAGINSAFSLYYGKFQSAAFKIGTILKHVEDKFNVHSHYRNIMSDCQKTYFLQRSPIMSAAVSKALSELKNQHKNDHSVLFRSSCLFTMKVCQDESMCYYYFFSKPSEQLNDYLAMLCQQLYDHLRPSLIGINHLEVLTELCGILRREMLSDHILMNESLEKFIDIVRQMLEDVEERLVFRSNVFFQHDISAYQPSPGDLAYPEKLKQMENIAVELSDHRADSRSSAASAESQEVVNINANQLGQFRSYTGNSPADLHGMWYPTVKRTLVCLSRLYFCLDREIFQGLAQEALAVCVQTIESAANQISIRKTIIDGKLFQIKHLLIIREQIAPFQVDFTVTEVSLDFSNVKNAAVGLIQNRNRLFTFSTNNALLEFLLEGTPKVKEYLIDSRKEIDKQLKISCEAFISHVTQILVGNITSWLQKAEHIRKISDRDAENAVPLRQQEFAKPQIVAGIVTVAQRNIKTKTIEIQKSMQLYLANRETEFILFRPIKNNVINAFLQLEQLLSIAKYTEEDMTLIACPSAEQINVLICSVSLALEQDSFGQTQRQTRSSLNQEIDTQSNTSVK